MRKHVSIWIMDIVDIKSPGNPICDDWKTGAETFKYGEWRGDRE